jgi:RHS repeat-associated protein
MTLDLNGAVSGRQAHLPGGEDFAESGTQEKHHFTSYERDSEATDYAVNRQYSSNVGRFLRVDLLSDVQGNPQSLNKYAYVNNDPVNAVDPLGLSLDKVTTCVCVRVEGGAWSCECRDIIDPETGGAPELAGGKDKKFKPWSEEKCLQKLQEEKAFTNTLGFRAKDILGAIQQIGGEAGADAARIKERLSGLESSADGIPPDSPSQAARKAHRLGLRTGELTLGLPGLPLEINMGDLARQGIKDVNDVITGFADLYNHCNTTLKDRDRQELDDLKNKVNGFSSLYRSFYDGVLEATNSGPI